MDVSTKIRINDDDDDDNAALMCGQSGRDFSVCTHRCVGRYRNRVYDSDIPSEVAVAEQREGGGGGAAPLQGRQFRSQMYFYYTNSGAHIYLAPTAIPPAPPL